MKRGLCNVGIGVACPGICFASWMTTVLCMSFSSVSDVCSLTFTIAIGTGVVGISLWYVAVAILSASLAEEASSGGLFV